MEIRPRKRAWAVALLSALTVVAFGGCTAVKKMNASKPAGAEEAPKKEYNWQDMSTGRSFNRPINPTPSD